MIMSKKMYSKGNPRKFIDKIALMKQKEALSNASFQSAIHGLTEIAMNRQPGNEIETLEAKGIITDTCSTNSYSPESFTSESTALSFKTVQPLTNEIRVDNLAVNRNNEGFNSCHELSQMKDGFQPQTQYDQVKYRHGSDRTHLPSSSERYSNIEGYYPHNKNLPRLYEPVSSGSLPDVSMWRNPKEFSNPQSNIKKHFRDPSNNEHIDLQETLSNLEHVKFGKSGKAALLEHLAFRAMQNASNPHPHHIQSVKDPATIGIHAIISSPSMHRAAGHSHDHADSDCTGNLNESGHLKHFSAKNSPYVSVSHRERCCAKESEPGYRQRYNSGLTNSSMKQMKLNINYGNDYDYYDIRNKALTPTGQQSNSWFDNMKNETNTDHLHPPMLSNVLANENGRRVSSDSNIQNSLKYQGDRMSQTTTIKDSPFERVNSLKREQTMHPYQRNQSMTSYQPPNTQNSCDTSSQSTDFQRENSQFSVSSSFLDNLLALQSPDENLDPSLMSDGNIFRTPDFSQGHVFVFGDFKDLPKDIIRNNVPESPLIDSRESRTTGNNDAYMDPYVKEEETKQSINYDTIIENSDNFENSNGSNGHECYWGQSNESHRTYTKELSPTIKPCENLDPQNVIVDIYSDFEGIPEITLMDVDAQRRDSLKWTDEVLGNLNSDSGNGDNSQCRERSTSLYQPMVSLTEEDRSFADVHEY